MSTDCTAACVMLHLKLLQFNRNLTEVNAIGKQAITARG